MTLRTVAELSASPDSRDSVREPTGCAVADVALHQHPQQPLRALVQDILFAFCCHA